MVEDDLLGDRVQRRQRARPLSSEYGTHKTVKADSCLGFQVNLFKVFSLRSAAAFSGPSTGVPHSQETAPPLGPPQGPRHIPTAGC